MAVAVDDSLAAVEGLGAGNLITRLGRAAVRVGHRAPADTFEGDGRHLEQATAEDAPDRRREAVEETVQAVLGEVEAPRDGIDGHGFVLEAAEGGPRHLRRESGGVALVDEAIAHLLAAEPGVPGSGTARAVATGAGADRVGVEGARAVVEADRPDAAEPEGQLAVRHVDVAARHAEDGSAVGGAVPDVTGAGNDLTALRHDPRAEADGQREAVGVRQLQGTVGPGNAHAGGRPSRARPERRARRGAEDRTARRVEELAPVHDPGLPRRRRA